jgi:hypothetical protein
MSGGAPRSQCSQSSSNDYNYDTSIEKILLDTESKKKSKHCQFLICLGVVILCFAFVLCITLFSSNPGNHLSLEQRKNTDAGKNSLYIYKTFDNTPSYNTGIKNK